MHSVCQPFVRGTNAFMNVSSEMQIDIEAVEDGQEAECFDWPPLWTYEFCEDPMHAQASI